MIAIFPLSPNNPRRAIDSGAPGGRALFLSLTSRVGVVLYHGSSDHSQDTQAKLGVGCGREESDSE